MTTVLVLDGQLRSALAVVRSLGRRDVEVRCGAASRVATAFFSRYVEDSVIYPDPELDSDGFVSFLRRYLQENDIDVVLPVGHETTQLASRHREQFAEHAALPVPSYDRFEAAVDKGLTIEAAAAAGVPCPRTIQPTDVSDAVERVVELEFPVVVKPRTESGSRGLKFVDDPDEFPTAYESVHRSHPRPIVQEQIPRDGPGMGTAFLRDDGQTRAAFAYRRIREYPPSGGPSTLRVSVDRPDLLDYGERLLQELDWRGVAMVEFKLDTRSDTPKLMEINPRFWGSLHLPLYAGVDFPWAVLQYALGQEVDPQTTYEIGVECRYLLPGDLLYLTTVRDWDGIREFFPFRGVHYDILSLHDPGPTLGRMLAMARFSASPRMWRKVILRGGTTGDTPSSDRDTLADCPIEEVDDGAELEH